MVEQMSVEHRIHNQAVLDALGKMTKAIEHSTKAAQKSGQESKKAADLAAGSFAKLERELKDNEKALIHLTRGTKEYAAQKSKVDNLRRAHAEMKSEIKGSSAQMKGFGSITDVVGEKVIGLVGGIGLVTGAVETLRAALENIERGNNAKRLATVDFEEGLVAGQGNFVDSKDRGRVRNTSLRVAEEQGLNPGGVAIALGNLKSRGAENLDEATEFLVEAAKLRPGNLAAAEALASAGLVEKRGIGTGTANEVLGGILSAQVASQASDTTEFAQAFSANTVSLVQSGGYTPEQAREEAVKFSVVEPKSLDIAATSEKAFFRAIRKFEPEADGAVTKADIAEFKSAATQRDQVQVLERNAGLRQQFIRDLPDEGRNAIMRRIDPNAADSATFAQVEKDVVSGAEAARRLLEQQQRTRNEAAFLIQDRQSEAADKVSHINANALSKFEDSVLQSANRVRRNARDDSLGESALDYISVQPTFGVEPVTAMESIFGGISQSDARLNQMAFIARNDPEQNDRQQAVKELHDLLTLAKAQGLDSQAQLIKGLLDETRQTNELLRQQQADRQQTRQANNVAPPVESPVPAAALGDN